MLVKICGIQTIEVARVAVEAGADFLGFVFAKSKRQVTKEQAREIIATLPTHIKTVGVFVNETVDEMKATAEISGLDYIQLHGDETAEVAYALPYKIIKAFPVTKETLPTIQDYPANYYILDSPIGGNRGVNGTTYDCELEHTHPIDQDKIIIAGDLTTHNVQKAIKKRCRISVDVYSGRETNGNKDRKLIQTFIKQAKSS